MKGKKNLNELVIPFFYSYVVLYSSKFNKREFDKFLFIFNKLIEKSKFERDEYINIIKLIYELNPEGKGKKRKRTLMDVLLIIEKNK
jgi:hypothetical protein